MSTLSNQYIELLAYELDLGDLQFATRGVVELQFEGGVAVTLENAIDDDALILHSPLDRLEEDASTQGGLFERLLRWNHADNNPLGMILGIDEGAGALVLSLRISMADTKAYESLVNGLQALVARVAGLRRLLGEPPSAPGSRSAPPVAEDNPLPQGSLKI